LLPKRATSIRLPSLREAIAQFWTVINSKRGRTALHVDATTGIAICDTDPLKLHYDFCLLRIGEIRIDQMDADHRAARDAMSERRLGVGGQHELPAGGHQTCGTADRATGER